MATDYTHFEKKKVTKNIPGIPSAEKQVVSANVLHRALQKSLPGIILSFAQFKGVSVNVDLDLFQYFSRLAEAWSMSNPGMDM